MRQPLKLTKNSIFFNLDSNSVRELHSDRDRTPLKNVSNTKDTKQILGNIDK